ncbi:hypothetical protein SLEP1_g18271 [Rubroshorea leprosula]|uniref:Uncharacterized protein n=1 Tax=Rubroshorea leprosula TaxID=152421 RepID=A0AAV5J2S3_9ROSI|nr:hypothetical protein SLEP1_g18271 [Rubroshorea leprosula]
MGSKLFCIIICQDAFFIFKFILEFVLINCVFSAVTAYSKAHYLSSSLRHLVLGFASSISLVWDWHLIPIRVTISFLILRCLALCVVEVSSVYSFYVP